MKTEATRHVKGLGPWAGRRGTRPLHAQIPPGIDARGKERAREGRALTIIHGGHRRRVPTANVLVERAGATGVSLEGNEELRKEEDVNDGPRLESQVRSTHLTC